MMRSNGDLVRVLHVPSGISASCNCERGQFRNRLKAMKLLRSRLWASENIARAETIVRTYEVPD